MGWHEDFEDLADECPEDIEELWLFEQQLAAEAADFRKPDCAAGAATGAVAGAPRHARLAVSTKGEWIWFGNGTPTQQRSRPRWHRDQPNSILRVKPVAR
jgi:diadenosine tetraphosphate (Ap4A) HIT family hydrolase